MALKLLKVSMTFEVKADPRDSDAVREEVYEYLSSSMEYEELEFQIMEDDDAEEESEE
jgi:hypothetical protein